jgi:hypothetical protein
MVQHRKPQDAPGAQQQEARALAEKAVARRRAGDRQEGQALEGKAKALDRAAAEDVVKSGAKKPSG